MPPASAAFPKVLPIIPTSQRVLLPGLIVRLKLGRSASTNLVESKIWRQYERQGATNLLVGCVPLRSPSNSSAAGDDPRLITDGTAVDPANLDDKRLNSVNGSSGNSSNSSATVETTSVATSELFSYGCAARVIKLERSGDARDGFTMVLEGLVRFRIDAVVQENPFLEAAVTPLFESAVDKKDMELEALATSLKTAGRELLELLKELKLPGPVLTQMKQYIETTPPGQLADLLASTIDASVQEKLEILAAFNIKERIEKTIVLVTRQIQVLKISQKIASTVEGRLSKKQREFYLRQQLKAIKEELGEKDEGEMDEADELAKKISEANLPEEADKAAQRELKRMKRMHPSQAEYTVVRNYLEWLSEIPWSVSSNDAIDISEARRTLDEDHYGLEKVKTRILEFLAVRKLKADLKGPILCFIGPPGVGKTSLGRSIATALGRKFYRLSLGGVRDEAEIRGHRRTYIGALPGCIINGVKKTGVNNPVILLDEIDKLGRDIRGDPSSALLEVLDPEQNKTFVDHYLNVPFDLSKVLFIATANDADTIPSPLLDRMEIIRIPGYTLDEKLVIARKHLVPKQLSAHGVEPSNVIFPDEAITFIATGYTREAGVRGLEREVGAVSRSLAVKLADTSEMDRNRKQIVSVDVVEQILGPITYEDDMAERTKMAGVATGLAWTSTGGGILFIEVTRMPGKGKLVLTGKLGDVIKESAHAALSWVRAHAADLGVASSNMVNILDKHDIHIHFPAGSTPKDGPSAGVTIVAALVSLLTGKVIRAHTAMTGEITLRGLVLPVGGIKEKVLAAHRAGIKRVVLPFRNQKDVVEVPANVRQDMEVVYAKNVADVLRAVFDDNVVVFDQVTASL